MAVTKKFSSVSPPSNISIYGEGTFLVGFFGETTKYSKNGKLWYEHPKNYDWSKGNYAELDDVTINDNNKTIDFSSTPIFIQSFQIETFTTATVGSRRQYLKVTGTNTVALFRQTMTASSDQIIVFGENTDTSQDLPFDYWMYYTYSPKFWNDNIPFFNQIQYIDTSNIDGNDDYRIYIKGVYALPKYNWIKFENCKNFQIEKVTESLGDGVFSGNLPHSLKVLKV